MDNREHIAALAQKARTGNQDAFNELYLLTRDRAYFVAFSITKDEQDALDILQDSYLKAWQGIGSLQNPEQFPAWLHQITGNTAKNYVRQRKPQLFQPGVEDETDILGLQAEKDSGYIPDAAMDTEGTRRLPQRRRPARQRLPRHNIPTYTIARQGPRPQSPRRPPASR